MLVTAWLAAEARIEADTISSSIHIFVSVFTGFALIYVIVTEAIEDSKEPK